MFYNLHAECKVVLTGIWYHLARRSAIRRFSPFSRIWKAWVRTVPPSIGNFTFIGWLLSFPCLCTCKTCVRESLLAANAIYEELYGEPGQGEGQAAVVMPATFQVTQSLISWLWKSLIQVYYWIGWKPDKNQPKPLRPQKSDVSRPQSINICFLCKWLSGELKRSLQIGWACRGQGFHWFDWW